MANFFGVEVDISNMTLEELEDSRKKVRDMLASIEWQIAMEKMAMRKYSSKQSSPAEL